MKSRRWVVALLLVSALCGVMGGCSIAARAFQEDDAGQSDVTRAGEVIQDVGQATGIPWVLAIGQVVTAVGAAVIAVRKARSMDASPLTAAERAEVVAAVRAEGVVPPAGRV